MLVQLNTLKTGRTITTKALTSYFQLVLLLYIGTLYSNNYCQCNKAIVTVWYSMIAIRHNK